MAFDVASYAKELIDAAGMTDVDQRKAFEAFLLSDKVKSKLEATGREATEGIERERGRTAAEKAKAEKAEADKQAYYQDQLKIATANKAVVDETNRRIAAYETAYGPLDEGQKREVKQGVIDEKTFNERINLTENNTVGLVKAAATITARHLRNFNEEPDFDAIEKIATEKKLTAMKAYEEWARPKYDEKARLDGEKAKEADAARVKAAVDAALVEDRSKRAASQTVDPGQRSEFLTNAIKSNKEPLTKQESFLKGWREPNPSAAMEAEFGRKH